MAGQATPPTARRSPAAVAAWLTVPLLVWGSGYWLVAADEASPAAVVDGYLSGWTDATAGRALALGSAASEDPASLAGATAAATSRLRSLCADGTLPDDCADAPGNLLNAIRFEVVASGDDRAIATAEVVRFERQPTTFLGIFNGTELVPVAQEEILRLDLAARPAAIGSRRWTIAGATVP
jgi:hypothetical protein